MLMTAAPGESFADALAANRKLELGGYNQKHGVAIRNAKGPAIEITDNVFHVTRLQVKSDSTWAMGGMEERSCNLCSADYSIIEGGEGAKTTVAWGAAPTFSNDLIISHGAMGIFFDYPGALLHSTVIQRGNVADSVGVEAGWNWIFPGQVVTNTAIFGFAHAAASSASPQCQTWQCITWLGGNNVTDAPQGDHGTIANGWWSGTTTVYVYTLPKTTYGSSANAAFAQWPGDYRLASKSPLKGAGSAYGPFKLCPEKTPCKTQVADTPDLLGTDRPQAGRYDVGAWQSTQ
jgi:hypothetical protein